MIITTIMNITSNITKQSIVNSLIILKKYGFILHFLQQVSDNKQMESYFDRIFTEMK